MADETNTSTEDGKSEFKAPASQEELDRIIGDRLSRERAKFADYDDLKAKASQFDAAEEANKSELQKAQETAKSAVERAEKAERSALVASVAAEKGVPAASLTGSTKEELEAAADALIAWRGEQKKPAPKAGDLKSGTKADDTSGMTGKERAAAALRQLRAQGG